MAKVSIIVITYNSKWDKLKITVNSILMQTGIEYEIVFSDDGSKNKLNNEIISYLKNSCHYRFADSDMNIGTIANILNGVKKATGEYIKVISPGDCFYDKDALKNWVESIEESQADMSFCNAVYYKYVKDSLEVIHTKASPKNLYLYKKQCYRKLFIDYLLANDSILGAAVLVKKNIILQYLQEMQGKVFYAEDYMIRIMIYDKKIIDHFHQTCLWYEYGEGISTSNSDKWSKLLQRDFEQTNKIIENRNISTDKIHKRYRKLLEDKGKYHILYKIKKALFFPRVIVYRFRMKFFYQITSEGNIDDLKKIMTFQPTFK